MCEYLRKSGFLFLFATAMFILWPAVSGEETEMKTYRIGLVSLDEKSTAHSYWFPYFFNRTDLEALGTYRRRIRARLERHPFDTIENFEITKVWAGSDELKDRLAETFFIPEKLNKWQDAAGGVDGVLIVDTMSSGGQHLEMAKFFLEKGIPVFVDKPFAPDYATAYEIVQIAKKTGTPLMSASVLRYVDEAGELKRDLVEVGKVRFVQVVGQGDTLQYGIHPTELLYGILGPGMISVKNSGDDDTDIIHFRYQDGAEGVLLIFRKVRPNFRIFIYGDKWQLDSNYITAVKFDRGAHRMLSSFAEMVKTGKPPIDYDEILEVMKVLTAAIESRERKGETIPIN